MALKLMYGVTIIIIMSIDVSNGRADNNVLRFEKHSDYSHDKRQGYNSLGVNGIGQERIRKWPKVQSNRAGHPVNVKMNHNMNSEKDSFDHSTTQSVQNRNSGHHADPDFNKHQIPDNVLYFDKKLQSTKVVVGVSNPVSFTRTSDNSKGSNKLVESAKGSNTITEKTSSTQISNRTSLEQDANACTKELFGGDDAAYQACRIQDALQTNWFPSPVAGLYYRSYLDWNGFDGFWQNGAILETMANFMHYTASHRYSEVFRMAGRSMEELLHAYYPMPSFDDEGWFAVSYARVYEVTGNLTYLNTSEYMYNFLWTNGWDGSMTCSGGMWFGGGHNKKITITNAQMLLLGAKLYRLLRNETYLNRSLLSLDYLTTRVLNHTSYLLADSIEPYDANCTALPKFNITYNSGMFIGGLVELYKATGNGSHLELAHKVAMATIKNNSPDGVLLEYCDWDDQCANDQDAQLFKGIFVRNVRYLMDVSNTTQRDYYQKWLETNVQYALANAQCLDPAMYCAIRYPDGPSRNPTKGPLYTSSWRGPYMFSDVISQTSALDLFVSAIDPNTECAKGDAACDYNPKIPAIGPLTCADNPCQKGHQCCTWDDLYATCCMPYETCYGGGCY